MSPERADRLQAVVWTGPGLAILWLPGPILAPLLLAAILAYICDPLVERLEGWRVARTIGVMIVMPLAPPASAALLIGLREARAAYLKSTFYQSG